MPYIPGATGPNLLKSSTEAVDWDKIEREEKALDRKSVV